MYELLLSPSEFTLSNQLFIHGQIHFLHPRLCRTTLVELRWHCTFLPALSRKTLSGLRAQSHGATEFEWRCCLIKSPSSLLLIFRLRFRSIWPFCYVTGMAFLWKWQANFAHWALKAKEVRRHQLTLQVPARVLAKGNVNCKLRPILCKMHPLNAF